MRITAAAGALTEAEAESFSGYRKYVPVCRDKEGDRQEQPEAGFVRFPAAV